MAKKEKKIKAGTPEYWQMEIDHDKENITSYEKKQKTCEGKLETFKDNLKHAEKMLENCETEEDTQYWQNEIDNDKKQIEKCEKRLNDYIKKIESAHSDKLSHEEELRSSYSDTTRGKSNIIAGSFGLGGTIITAIAWFIYKNDCFTRAMNNDEGFYGAKRCDPDISKPKF